MTLYVLDTDTLTLLEKGHTVVRARVAARQPGEVATTVIRVEEQLSGWYRRLRRAKQPAELAKVYDRLAHAVKLLAGLPILSFPEPAILRGRSLESQRLNVRRLDLCIAAIALELQAVVVTRNLRDFQRVPGLVAEDWSLP
jgi:tRNA(fMet)-specific endonuclease VapC